MLYKGRSDKRTTVDNHVVKHLNVKLIFANLTINDKNTNKKRSELKNGKYFIIF